MRNIVENYSPKNNFWEYNPQFTLVHPFRKLWKSDRTKDKSSSSNLMWAIALIHHPKSDLYNVTGKEDKISDTVLGISGANVEKYWEDNKEIVDAFIDSALTQAEKSLVSWCEYMKKRDIYLKNTEYYFDQYKTDKMGNNVLSKTGQYIVEKGTAEQLDKAWGASKSMWADYEKVMKAISEEEDLSTSKKIKSGTANGEM